MLPLELRGADAAAAAALYPLALLHAQDAPPLAFAPQLLVSRNFFKLQWRGHRRVRNVAALLEWHEPHSDDAASADPAREAAAAVASPARVGRVREALVLYGADATGAVDEEGAVRALQALGFAPSLVSREQLLAALSRFGGGGGGEGGGARNRVSAEQLLRTQAALARELHPTHVRYVAVTLREAEALRFAIHARHPACDFCALLTLDGRVLAASAAAPRASAFARAAALAAFRFADSQMYLSDSEAALALRAVEASPPAARSRWFHAMLQCRVRDKMATADTPVAAVLAAQDVTDLLTAPPK
jgi:hypothetical protein